MKPICLLLAVLFLAGCATDSQGRKEKPWEAVRRWDDSIDNTIDRLQDKSYRD